MRFLELGLVLLAVTTLVTSCATRSGETSKASAHFDPEFTAFFQRTNGWLAGDGAISLPLQDGRVIWLFGDSHIDDIDPKDGTMAGLFQARNAGLLQEKDGTTSTLVGQGPGFRSWFKDSTGDAEWFWPLCGFQEGATVYVYLSALRKTAAGGMWGFENIGHDYWGVLKTNELEHPSDYLPLPPFNGINFGDGFFIDGDYVYAFGGKGRGIAADLFVARFRRESPASDWRFWDGKRWSENVTDASAIGRGASTSLHVCKVNDTFVLTTSAFSVACDQATDIFVATSSEPTGPFSKLRKIYTIEDRYRGHVPFFYFPILHPEFVNDQQEILMTYSINGYEPCIPSTINGRAIPEHYRPRAVRVPRESF